MTLATTTQSAASPTNVVRMFNLNTSSELAKPYWVAGRIVEVGQTLPDRDGELHTRAILDVEGHQMSAIFRNVSKLDLGEEVQGPVLTIYGAKQTPVLAVTVPGNEDPETVELLKARYLGVRPNL